MSRVVFQPRHLRSPAKGPCRRGAMLLEVVISLGILMVAMGVIGLAFNNGQQKVEFAERMIRAMIMTEKLVAEMDTDLLDLEDREQSGWFGPDVSRGVL